MDDYRPDPDALLAAVQKDEARQQRGKLKIFLGMSAGVGKTYAMLQAAHEMRQQGADIVIGFIETHQRKETEALVAGLERLPLRSINYRGAVLQEMDVDAILKRRPSIVLIDELPHSNIEGSRHPNQAAGMAGPSSRNAVWARDRGLYCPIPSAACRRRYRHDTLGQGAGRDAPRLCPPVGQALAGSAIVDQADGRAVGIVDAGGHVVLLLPRKAGWSSAVGKGIGGSAGRVRAVRSLQQPASRP